jgi:hypothetical protein
MVQHRYVFKLAIMKAITNGGQKNPYTGEMFFAQVPKAWKKKMAIKKFTEPWGVDSKFLHCAFANLCMIYSNNSSRRCVSNC